MCDPLTIAGIALTAGSTVANTMAQNKVAKARSAALQAERLRQAGLDREAEALNTVSQDRYGPEFEKGQAETGQKLGDYLAKQDVRTDAAAAGGGEVLPSSSSDIVVRNENEARAKATAQTQQQGQALGTLRAFGDYLGDTSRLQGRDASLIGQIGGFKQGSSSVVPYELDAASHAGDSMKMFGDILNFGGSLAMGKGLSGTLAPNSASVATIGGAAPLAAPVVSDPWAGMRTVTSARPRASLLDLYGGVGR